MTEGISSAPVLLPAGPDIAVDTYATEMSPLTCQQDSNLKLEQW
jgi:hypothetical protein